MSPYFSARMAGERMSVTDSDDLVVAEFDERLDRPLTDLGDDERGGLRNQAREALRAYLTEIAPQIRPRSVERRIEMKFQGAGWSFVGYVDVEDERGHVIDLKVGAKHVTETAAARDPQATGYLLARAVRSAGHATGVPLGQARSDPLGGALSGGASRAQRSRARAVRGAHRSDRQEMARYDEAGEWPLSSPDGWWCARGQCPAWSLCPGGAGC